jgi:CheY-like chemotaxis protein
MGECDVILVVDDEKAVRGAIAAMLSRAGYGVVEASGATEALRILESRSDVMVLLTDCTMPGMRGEELATAVVQRWPEIKIIAMSGQPRSAELPDGATYIAKPFRLSTLDPLMRAFSAAPSGAVQPDAVPLPGSAPADAPERLAL